MKISSRAFICLSFSILVFGATVVFASTVPDAPANVTPAPTFNGQVPLTWSAPVNNGGAAITSYDVYQRTGGTGGFSLATNTAATAFTFNGTNGTTYEFQLDAVNSVGSSTMSTSTYGTPGNVLFSDPFSTTTINSNIWTEADSAAGGAGGTAGNVQQTGTALTIKGNSNYGTNALYSTSTFDRTISTTTVEADITSTPCTGAATTSSAFGYGDTNPFASSTDAYVARINNGALALIYYDNGIIVGNQATGFTCTSGVPFHVKLVVRPTGGAVLYVNGTTTPVTVGLGTFTNKPIVLESITNLATTTYDNFAMTLSPVAPSVPTGLSAAASSTQVALTWTTPSSDGGAAIADYFIEYKQSATSTWSAFNDGVSTAASTTVTGLSNGTSYDFRVSAINSAGTSTVSSTATATPGGAPSTPVNLEPVPGNAQVSLSWTAASNGGSPITAYDIYKRVGESGNFSFVGTTTSTSYTATALTNGTTYEFHIDAVNALGTSTVSSSVFSTPGYVGLFDSLFSSTTVDASKWSVFQSTLGNVAESTSSGLSVIGDNVIGDNGISSLSTWDRTLGTTTLDADISQNICTSGGGAFLGYGDSNPLASSSTAAYMIQMRSGFVNLSNYVSGTLVGSNTSSLKCGANIPFHVSLLIAPTIGAEVFINGSSTVAVSANGGTYTNKGIFLETASSTVTSTYTNVSLVTAAPVPPSAPTGLTAIASGTTQALLSWTAPSNGGSAITNYEISYRTGSNAFATATTPVSTSTSATISGLSANTTYEFRVDAVNAVGTSTVSSSAFVTTPSNGPATPTSLAPVPAKTQVSLSWNVPSANGSPILYYGVSYRTGNAGSYTNVTSNIDQGTPTSTNITIGGLTDHTPYEFRVTAVNANGTSTPTTSVYSTPGNVLFSDSFSSTTIDAGKWTELDTGGLGGSVGNVQQDGSVLKVVGDGTVGDNGVYSSSTFDRSAGTTTIDADITSTACNASGNTVGLGYGDINPLATSTDSAYEVVVNGGTIHLYYFTGGSLSGNSSSGIACTNNVPFHVSLLLGSAGGAEIFINGTTTPNAVIGGGVFTNKPVFLTSTNAGPTISYDNLYVVGPTSTADPDAPSGLTAVPGESQVGLSWTAPSSNGNDILYYEVSYRKGNTGPYTDDTSNVDQGTPLLTNISVGGLTDRATYQFQVAAVNINGTSTPTSSVNSTPGNIILSDPFASTTIDAGKWTELDTGGLGAGVGNVQENGSVLKVIGDGTVGDNGLYSSSTFDRSIGTTTVDADITSTSCNASGNTAGLGYGDINPLATSTNSAYEVVVNGGTIHLYYFTGGSLFGNSNSGVACTNNVPFHISLWIAPTGGAEIFINGSSTPSAVVGGGTFTNKPFFVTSTNVGATISYGNLYVTGSSQAPGAPSVPTATPGDGQVALSWSAPSTVGESAVTNYNVLVKSQNQYTYATSSASVSNATSRTVTGLTNGLYYTFKVSAANGSGTGPAGDTLQVMPIASSPQAPSAVSPAILGFPNVGEYLGAAYSFVDPNGDLEATSIYQWYRSSTIGGTYAPISGATNQNYLTTSSDLNQYLEFSVTPMSMNAPAQGAMATSAPILVTAAQNYLNHIVATGQSFSTGVGGNPALTTSQPYSNKKLDFTTESTLISLIEVNVETPNSAEGNYLTAVSPGQSFQNVITNGGVSGADYAQLKKGTAPYATSTLEVASVVNDAPSLGKVSRVIAITNLHGGADDQEGNMPVYDSYLDQWDTDFNTDIKALTGQSTDIPMLIFQGSSFPEYNKNGPGTGWATSSLNTVIRDIGRFHPTRFIVASADYIIPHNPTTPLHPNNIGYRVIGEYMGKVMEQAVVKRQTWNPLMPISVKRNANVIYIKYHVPVAPIAFDTTLVAQQQNYGFEYFDNSSSASISNVSILNADTVKITLNTVPTGSNQRVRYAYTATPNTIPGPDNSSGLTPGSPRGNLRDSDATTSPAVGSSGTPLYDWGEIFDEPVLVDTSAPVISNVTAAGMYSGSTTTVATSTIHWSTDIGASTQVQYGLTSSYIASSSVVDNASVGALNHSVSLQNLAACTVYHYGLTSVDILAQNASSSPDQAFATGGCAGGATPLASSTAFIGAGGGSISLNSGTSSASVSVPSGFGTAAYFQIKQLSRNVAVASTSLPSGLAAVGTNFYDMKALTTATSVESTFSQPLHVTFSYNNGDLGIVNVSTLAIKRWDGTSWADLPNCSINTSAKTVTCDTSGFSTFGLFGQNNVGATVPGAPTGVAATAGDSQAAISFNPPVSDGSSTIVSYTVTSNPGTISATDVGSPITVNGLTDGVAYTFTVTATNGVGTGPASASSSPVTPLSSLPAPVPISVAPIGGGGPAGGDIIGGSAVVVLASSSMPSIPPVLDGFTFVSNLLQGNSSAQVKKLQIFLNSQEFTVAASGAGSPGRESNYFGALTKKALIKFQEAHADKILEPSGLLHGTGYFGPSTRAFINAILRAKR